MPEHSVRNVGEAVAVLGVVASLVFVGLELRESRIASRAAAYQELGTAVANNWMGRANDRELLAEYVTAEGKVVFDSPAHIVTGVAGDA